MLRHNESYCKFDFFALNQKDILILLKNLLAQIALSQSILTQFCTMSFFVLFPLFSSAQHFIFDIKKKKVGNEDLLLKTRNNQRLQSAVDNDGK